MFAPGLSLKAMEAADRALAALEHLDLDEQLAATTGAVVGVLGALQERGEKTPEDREAFNRLCSETQTRLQREIEALRFEQP